VFVASYKLTVMGLPASTCPVRIPGFAGVEVGVGDPTGVEDVGVGDSTGVADVGVAVPTGVEEVGVGDPSGVEEVGVADPTGVEVVGVGDPTGVEDVGVGDSTGVEEVGVKEGIGVGVNVGVTALPTIIKLVPVEGIDVRILSPFETRAVHSIAVCPACRPVAVNVKAAPLVVALFPLLPAIATMKLPFCGPLVATAGSAPKRLVTVMLLTSTKLAL
jgi:hypothetical protein